MPAPTRKKAKAVKKKAPPRPRYTRPPQAAAPINQHTTPAGLERLIDVNSVAQVLLCSTRMVRKLQAEDPDFPRPIRLGTLTRWRVRDIEAFFNKRGPRGRQARA